VVQDRPVRLTGSRRAVGSPLSEPAAVAPSMSGNDQRRVAWKRQRRCGRRGRRGQRQERDRETNDRRAAQHL